MWQINHARSTSEQLWVVNAQENRQWMVTAPPGYLFVFGRHQAGEFYVGGAWPVHRPPKLRTYQFSRAALASLFGTGGTRLVSHDLIYVVLQKREPDGAVPNEPACDIISMEEWGAS